MIRFFRAAWLVTRTDLLIEVRSREILYTTLFFAVSCVLVFAFGFVDEGRALEGGGTVFVNRGFVPQPYQEAAALGDLHGEDPGVVTISGIVRSSETAGFMTPEPDMSNRIEWVRDPVRLAKMVDPALAPIAPFYVDLPAGPAGELPQGGETTVSFPNNHFGYALTWYGFAIVAVVMLGFWLTRQARRPASGP